MQKTPVIKSGDFEATSFDVNATEFEYKLTRTLLLVLATLVGGMIGVVYVLIAQFVAEESATLQPLKCLRINIH